MTVMPVPSPFFPTPAAFPMPAPDPLYGQNPYARGSTVPLGSNYSYLDPNLSAISVLSQRSATQARLFAGAQLAAGSNALGIPGTLTGDPSEWTPQEAAQQTDRALAKLSTVNPELANQLAAKRAGKPPEDQGFLSDLMELGGDIVGGGLSVFGKVLEVVARPAHIVPNLVHDLVDGGDFDFGEDVMGALSGTMNHNWNSVFQEMGWNGDGFLGALRATLGFVGDVATDPITWVFPAGAGIKAAEAGATGARAFATSADAVNALARNAPELAGKSPGDVAAFMRARWDDAFASADIREALRSGRFDPADAAERVAAATSINYSRSLMDAQRAMFEVGADAYRLTSTRGLNQAVRAGINLGNGVVDARAYKTFLEEAVKRGNWSTAPSRFARSAEDLNAWQQGRAFASIAGGLRMKVAIPFTDFRYISPAYTNGLMAKALPGFGFAGVSRFFAGQSAVTSMLHEIGTGNGAVQMDHLKYWMEHGWRKFNEDFPEAADAVRGRGRGPASMYYSASERAGGITAHFSSGAKAARTGLVGYYGHRAQLQANNETNNFIRDVLRRVLDDEDNRDLIPNLETQWGISTRSKKMTATPEMQAAVVRYLDYFPEGVNTRVPDEIEAFFHEVNPRYAELVKKADQGLNATEEELLGKLEARLDDMKATARTVHDSGKDVSLIDKFRPVWDGVGDEAAKHDIPMGDARLDFSEVQGIPLEQADQWRRGAGLAHPITADLDQATAPRTYYIRASTLDAEKLQELRNRGMTSRALTHDDDGYGVVLHSVQQSPDDIAVIVRGNDFAQVDPHTGNMAMPREGKPDWTLADEMAEARRVRDEALAAAAPKQVTATPQSTPEDLVRATRADGYSERIVPPEELYRQEAELRTEALKANRQGVKGVYRQDDAGEVTLTVFDHKNVMPVGDDFQAVRMHRGFLHRTLNEKASKWLNGNLKTETDQVLLSVPQLRAQLARETLDMTFRESNDYVRQRFIAIIRENHPTNPELAERIIKDLPDQVWETNLAKVHGLYLNDLAQATRARYLSFAGERIWRATNLAPHMLGAPPRHLEHDWMLPPGVVRAVARNDKKLVKQVLGAHKKAAQYMNRQHKYQAAVANDFGTFSMLVDDALAEGQIARASREGDAWIRYGMRRSEARRQMDQADSTLSNGIARLEEEEARILTQRKRVIDAHGPEMGSRFDAELEAGNVYYNRQTDSVLHKDGEAFVKRGGGSRLRPLHDIELEWTELNSQLERVRQLRDSFETLGFLPETQIRGSAEAIEDLTVRISDAEDVIASYRARLNTMTKEQKTARDTLKHVKSQGNKDMLTAQINQLEGRKDIITKSLKEETEKATRWRKQLTEAKAGAPARMFHGSGRAFEMFDERYFDNEALFGPGVYMTDADEVAQSYMDAATRRIEHTESYTIRVPAFMEIDQATADAGNKIAEGLGETPGVTFGVGRTPFTHAQAKRMAQRQAEEKTLEELGEERAKTAIHYATDARLVEDPEFATMAAELKEVRGRLAKMLAKGDPADDVKFEKLRQQELDLSDKLAASPQHREYEVVITRGVPPEPGTLNPTLKEGYLDIRNPFRADRTIDEDTARTLMGGIDKLKARVAKLPEMGPPEPGAPSGTYIREVAEMDLEEFEDMLRDVINGDDLGTDATMVYRKLSEVLGADLKETNAFLAEAGFDGITYNGGHRIGGLGSHRAAVAFKPEQFIDIKSAPVKIAEASEFAMKARKVAAQSHTKAQKDAAEAAILMERARSQMDAAMTEVNKTMGEAKQLVAKVKPALQKAKTVGGLNGLTNMRIPGMEGFAMPDYIAEEWHRIYDANGPDWLRQEWRKFVIGPWKRWATYRWPGFHVRNFYGAFFNNWLGGVTTKHYGFAMRMMRNPDRVVRDDEFAEFGLKYLFGDKAKGKLTYQELRAHLNHTGVGGANVRVVADSANTTDMVKTAWDEVAKQRGRTRQAFRQLDHKMRGAGEVTENLFRFAAWAQGMEATGGDTWGARAFTMMRHGDYTDLTPAEDYIRDLVPFYKWMRTNIPYQIRMLAEEPGKVVAVSSKLKEMAYGVAGADKAEAELGQPDYLKQDLALPIPDWVPFIGSQGKKGDELQFAVFNLPYSDLYNGLNDYIASGLPYVRNVIESWGFERNAFTGRPLEGRMVKLSGIWNLPGIRDILAATSIAHKGPDGSTYISDKVENVLSGWPIWSRFRNFMEADPSRIEARFGGTLSMLAGVNIRPADFTQAELDFYYNEVEPLLQMYRDMGTTFPTADQFVDASASLYGGTEADLPPVVQATGIWAEGTAEAA